MRIISASLIILAVAGLLPAELTYNFQYTFQGHTSGTLLLVIHYRVYYESFASVDFTAQPAGNGLYRFFFKDIERTGYMMRTSGFTGRAFVVLASDYDLDKALLVGRQKLHDFERQAPEYDRLVRKKKVFQFRVFSRDKESMQFTRQPNGIHKDFLENFIVRFKYYPERLNICFNIYQILLETAKIYNHPFLPGHGSISRLKPGDRWQSKPLDYSPQLNRIGGLAAKIVAEYVTFKQQESFSVDYRVTEINGQYAVIVGQAQPQVKVWRDFLITDFSRTVKVRLVDGVTLQDAITAHIVDKKGKGLQFSTRLKLVE